MNATQIIESMNDLKQTIYNEIHHRILLRYTGQPILKDEKLFFILLPFLNGVEYDEAMQTGAVSVGIVQASLDEHEKIKESNTIEKIDQLTVLAGDIYSGRYYELLAQSGNIGLIRHLSSGIVARNEQQIKLYENKELSLEEWIQFITTVESVLVVQFYESLQQSQYRQVAMEALTIIRLNNEIQQIMNGQSSNLAKRMLSTGVTVQELQQRLQAHKQNLQLALNGAALNQASIQTIEKYCLS